ncbi:gas vesicle protein [Prauserella marina]|uniref:Gas vesicle protein A n=1 Tax=Prauserella marina TaxID=530584 RepID=A0A222VSZ3_9PSEU|nr:gas vesicle structural protein GvpA [Prauserella marina]ASR37034.1 gas vesicle protein [Prauserella marina]PWV79989.1 gas vesicle protein GvpA/GvpJ/GvpM family [Prauserella marina]SDD85582.1 Gas vesicle protein [Prauserella marina]
MTVVNQEAARGSQRGGSSGNLYDILELILDKGLVIDVFVRVSLVGIELLTIDARIVVASVDTYLRFAEACNRLDLTRASNATTLPGLLGDVTEKGAKGKTKGALTGAAETFAEQFTNASKRDEDPDDEDGENGERQAAPKKARTRRPARSTS